MRRAAFQQERGGFSPHADLLAGARQSTLYERDVGWVRSAVELPVQGFESGNGGRRERPRRS
jgi:hypothetical protein